MATSFYLNIAMLIVAVGIVGYVLYRAKGITKFELFIISSLFIFWTVMYLQKNAHFNRDKIRGDLGNWVWPIMAGIYQLMQAATRLPYGKLSQKLKSRKKVVQTAFFIVMVAFVMMIASGMSTWSMIIAAIAMGQYGATFGLDSQYISENYNIKKVFVSSSIAFTIPVVSSLFASTLYKGMGPSFTLDTYMWVLLGALIIGLIGFVIYSFKPENTDTITLDNMDPSARPFINRNMRDVMAISITAALMAFTYNFVLEFNSYALGSNSYQTVILSIVSLGASVLVGLFLRKVTTGRMIRMVSISLLTICMAMVGLLTITGDMSKWLWLTLMALASFGFGMYLMALFGSALHFDHKYPALVLGIFLSVKSFTLGSSTVITQEILVANPSAATVGTVILVITLVGMLSTYIASKYISNKLPNNDMDLIVDDSFKFENEYYKYVKKPADW